MTKFFRYWVHYRVVTSPPLPLDAPPDMPRQGFETDDVTSIQRLKPMLEFVDVIGMQNFIAQEIELPKAVQEFGHGTHVGVKVLGWSKLDETVLDLTGTIGH